MKHSWLIYFRRVGENAAPVLLPSRCVLFDDLRYRTTLNLGAAPLNMQQSGIAPTRFR